MKYDQHDGDEWFSVGKGFRWACCSCHLVHDVEIRRRNGNTEVRILRNERATQAMRRKHKQRVIIVNEDS